MGIEYRVLITKAVKFFHLSFKKHFFMSFELFVNEISCFFVFQLIFALENCPRCVIYIYICQSTEIFCRKVRLAEYFDNSNSDNLQSHHTAHKSTVWTLPAGRNLCIDTFVNHVRRHLNTFIKSKKNLNFHNHPTE